MELRDLHPTLQSAADRYPAFVRTSIKSKGFDRLHYDPTFPLLHTPRDGELFGEVMPALQHGEGIRRRQLTAQGVGEIVASRELQVVNQVNKIIPARRFLGVPLGRAQTVLVAGQSRRMQFRDLVAGGGSDPVSVLQYSTLSNGQTAEAGHKDSLGRSGNYINFGQTMPDEMVAEAKAIVKERPEQIRELARYAIEERIGISPHDYSFPDFQALAAENINLMYIGNPDIHSWRGVVLRPADPNW